MSLEEFKTDYGSALGDLSIARVTTLWKKSKTMSGQNEILAAINASRAAAAKDHARRSKVDHLAVDPAASVLPDAPMPDPVTKESKPAESETLELKPAESETLESKPAESETLESKPAESETLESKPAEHILISETRKLSHWEGRSGSVDHGKLDIAVEKLRSWILTRDISEDDKARRLADLDDTVEALLAAREKHGDRVDVLKMLDPHLG